MKPFTQHTGVLAPLDRADIDTDQIVPKQFLKRVTLTGYEDCLFYDWRQDPGFVLSRPEYAGASILVTGRNFGCGSSREHAVWALRDAGFRAVIAASFGDIFRTNALRTGFLPLTLAEVDVDRLMRVAIEHPGAPVTIDVQAGTVAAGDQRWSFALSPSEQRCLLEGLDDISLTLEHDAAITAHEARRPSWLPDMRRVTAV